MCCAVCVLCCGLSVSKGLSERVFFRFSDARRASAMVCLPTCLSVRPCICLSVYLSICPSVCVCVHDCVRAFKRRLTHVHSCLHLAALPQCTCTLFQVWTHNSLHQPSISSASHKPISLKFPKTQLWPPLSESPIFYFTPRSVKDTDADQSGRQPPELLHHSSSALATV